MTFQRAFSASVGLFRSFLARIICSSFRGIRVSSLLIPISVANDYCHRNQRGAENHPHPNLPPREGEGKIPSSACGGGLGWGLALATAKFARPINKKGPREFGALSLRLSYWWWISDRRIRRRRIRRFRNRSHRRRCRRHNLRHIRRRWRT